MSKLSGEDLAKLHSSAEWRTKFIELCDLLDILQDCIIANDYTIPVELNAALTLSPEGSSLKDRLIRKEGVPVPEAHLMCALTLGHEKLFVDVERTDLDKLRIEIHRQLTESRLRFPLQFGRALYDAYADLFEDEKDFLPIKETFQLIDRVPAGVFQYGHFTIGPFGLRKSLTPRGIRFSRRVPAYHCSDPVCRAVHNVQLSTGHEATINAERDKLTRVLERMPTEADDWWDLASHLRGTREAMYADSRSAVLIAVLGDTLSDGELRQLIARVLDTDKGSLRRQLSEFLKVGDSADAVANLGRAQLLQISLIATEDSVSRALDHAVLTREIVVPAGEVRRPVINGRMRAGAFALRPELGVYGARFVSSDMGLASLREKRLLNKLYVRDNGTDVEELDWQLRGYEEGDLDERLEEFFRSSDPKSALTRLVLARKTNMIAACAEVGLEFDGHLDDESLVNTILWKLGFDVQQDEDPHAYFWDLHQRVSALTQAARVSGIGDSETFRGTASTYFTQLEGVLTDSLAFSTWLLCNDHSNAPYPFSYDDEGDRKVGLQLLQTAWLDSSNDVEHFDFTSEKLELYSLIRGFGLLASHLKGLNDHADLYARASSDLPEYDGKTELKTFLFRSTIPFLNLTTTSRTRLQRGLDGISTGLQNAEVNQVRNDYSHYRRTSPEIERMAKALESIGATIRELESLGLARILCWPTNVTFDRWGRSEHAFAGPRSIEHVFARPSNFDWMGLPSLTEPQYLVHAAGIAEPNEILRVTRRYDGQFSRMWSDYPRPRKRATVEKSESEDSSTSTDRLELS